jgi:hypothetical protein
MAEHKHGEMNIEDHEKIFNGFVKFATRTAILIICILIFLALVNG